MIYVFRATDGSQLELDFPMAAAPAIGTPIRRGGKVYRRVATVQRPTGTTRKGRITSYTLPDRDTMHPDLKRHVDGWNEDGAPQFNSTAAARKWTDAERVLHAAGKVDTLHVYGDAPSCAEVRAAKKAGKPIKVDR